MSPQAVLIGATTGLGYALLAIGLVLVFRATKVVNFAHAEIGMFGATLTALVIANFGINYWIGLLCGLAAGALFGAVSDLLVVRRLAERSTAVLFVATAGLAQVVFLATISLPDVDVSGGYPTAFTGPIHLGPLEIPTEARIGGVFIQSRVMSLIVLAIPAVLALSWFLTRTRYGLMIRASASAPETARLVGVGVRRTSTLVWAIAGAFAAYTTILVLPMTGSGIANAAQPAGPGLLVRALVVALLARLKSLPQVILWGLVIGIGEAYLLRSMADRPGLTELAFLLLLLVLIPRMRSKGDRSGPAFSVGRRPEIVTAAQKLRSVRALPLVIFVLLALVPVFVHEPSQLNSWMFVLLLGAVAVSTTVLVGWAGQLSLGQYAFFGLGTATMLLVSGHGTVPIPFVRSTLQPHLPFVPALLVAGVVGAIAAVLIGLPASRARGMFLAVVTLAFAVAMQSFVLRQSFWTDGQETVARLERPSFGPIDLSDPKSLYLAILAFLGLVTVATLRLRRTGSGRTMIAGRDNPEALTAATVSPNLTMLIAFAFAGAVAAIAGGLLTTVPPTITLGRDFPALDSVRIVAVAIIGGLGSIPGAIVGALWVFGLPLLFESSPTVTLAVSGVGMLVLLLYLPGGLTEVADRALAAFLGWRQWSPTTPTVPSTTAPRAARPVRLTRATARRPASLPPAADAGLAIRDLNVTFGVRAAVDRVDLDVAPGEIVGLIGTNGAGKSTVLNAISGFVPARGRIELGGRSIGGLAAHRRAREGLARTFQSATLYPGLSVRETLMVALEGRQRSRFVPSLLALPPSPKAERAKWAEADELIDLLGLGRFADRRCGDLSTGTRRIVELAQLLASDASVLLLDEPTGGVAQREAEAFGPLIQRVRDELGAAVLLVEHDMPLVMGISDRVYCLELGRVIAAGRPSEVRSNDLVIASYLGADERAIARSGTAVAAPG